MDVREIQVERVCPNLRYVCSDEALSELAASIRASGLMEPIRVWFAGEHFRIIDGEKRWRACRKLGMTGIDAVVVEVVTFPVY